MPFRYSLNSATIRPVPILDKIRIAAETGYAGIELWHADIDAHLQSGGRLAEIRRALDDSGLFVPTTVMLKGWCEPTGEADAAGMDECRRRLEQAAAVGAPHAVAGPPHAHVDLEFAGARYRRLLELGLEMGLRPSIEYLGFAANINSIAAARTIMQTAGHPAATIVLDPFHDFRGGGGHEEIAALRAEQIAVVHFDDAPATPEAAQQRDADRVLPGEGVIPLQRVVGLLRQIGFAGWISLELFNETLWKQDPVQTARSGLQALKRVCAAE